MGSVATRGGARQRARAWSARRPAMRQRVTEAGQRRGIVWESVSSRDGASRPRNAREGGTRLDVGLPVRKPRRCRTTFGKISGARARSRAGTHRDARSVRGEARRVGLRRHRGHRRGRLREENVARGGMPRAGLWITKKRPARSVWSSQKFPRVRGRKRFDAQSETLGTKRLFGHPRKNTTGLTDCPYGKIRKKHTPRDLGTTERRSRIRRSVVPNVRARGRYHVPTARSFAMDVFEEHPRTRQTPSRARASPAAT